MWSLSLFVVVLFCFVFFGRVYKFCVFRVFGFCHTVCVQHLRPEPCGMHTVCMADTGRSRRALGISVTVAVFLSIRDWTTRTRGTRQRHMTP